MATPFVYNPKRNASQAIKGFYYQVELTVIRWLELEEDTILVCECGEDIDHVKQLLDADDITQERLLEQIKTRDRITLRSREALTALTRFRDAVVKNPSHRILYRFSTTAIPASERKFLFPRDLTGIEAWNAVTKNILTGPEVQEFVDTLKSLIGGATCPQGVTEPDFLQLQEYMASSDNQAIAEEFILRFEWATGLPEPPILRSEIQTLLLSQSKAYLQEEAQLLADVLTVHVFHLLSQSSEKILTVEKLDRLLEERSITPVDRRLITRLWSFVEEAQTHFRDLTSRMESISQEVAALQVLPEWLSRITQHVSGIETRLLPTRLPAPDEPPLPPRNFSRRPELIHTLLTKLNDVSWLAITGATGMGKSLAARLLSEEYGGSDTVWISLRGEQTSEGILPRLDLHLLRLASNLDRPDLVARYDTGQMTFSDLARHAVLQLGLNGLLVVDDLPDLLQAPALANNLAELTTAIRESGCKLLTTSQRSIPPSTRELLSSAIAEVPIPPMTIEDIDEMLISASAPQSLRHPGYLTLMLATTHGHPSLISATISFLRRHAWAFDENQLFAILRGDPTGEIRAEARRKLFLLLPNDDLRNLVYRLSLIATPFDNSLVGSVAAVEPPIPRPGELLAELTGPWVHQLTTDRFQISPLLRNAGQITLDFLTQQKVHRAIALHHMKNRTLDYEQASQIFLHLLAALDWSTLTWFLFSLATQLREKSHAEEFEYVTLLFTTSWPDEMTLDMRIFFRSVQVRLLMSMGKDAQGFMAELDAMIQSADPSSVLSPFMAHLLIGPMNPAAGPTTAAQRALQAGRAFRSLPTKIQQVMVLDTRLESLVWMGLGRIQTREDIRGVLNVLSSMSEDERRAACAHPILGYEGLQLFIDRYWGLEFEKPEGERDWQHVLSLLGEAQRVAELPGAEPLRPLVARAKAIVLADHMDRPQEALTLLEEAIPSADNHGRFVLFYTAGCVLLDHSTPEASLEHYQRALAESPSGTFVLHFDAFRGAVEAAGRAGRWALARDLTINLLKRFKRNELVYERLEMIGELAWVYWAKGDQVRACTSMSGLVRKLISGPAFENPRFHEVFRKTGHVLGWMTAITRTGEPPIHTEDGQPHSGPFPGLFSRPRPYLADISLPRLTYVLLYQLGEFATQCGLYELGWRKLCEARELAEREGARLFLHVIDLELAELAARKEKYGDAMRLALSGARAFLVFSYVKGQGLPIYTTEISPKEIWTGIPREQRLEAEGLLFWRTIGPSITRLLARDASPGEYANAIVELEQIVQLHQDDLTDSEYWLNILHEIRIAYSPVAVRETIYEQIRALPDSEFYLRLLLYLALPRTPNATLVEACQTHAASFDALHQYLRTSKLMIEYFSVYLAKYWKEVAENQAFALRSPKIFREGLRSLEQPTFPNVAKVLLLAADATGAYLADSVRQGLVAATGHSIE